ncbi:hypothetical protein Tco_0277891 [Tanacetum coccineum]
MVGVGHAAYIDRFHELASNGANNNSVLKAGMLTDEAIRNGSLKKNTKKRRNGGEPSRDGNVRNYNKRSRTGKAFSIVTNPVRKEYTGAAPKCTNCSFHYNPEMPCRIDSLSWHKAEIVCHEKVVRIPLPHGKILRVLGEKPEEKVRHLMSEKTKEQKQKDIVIVRNFPEVFPDDLSGLPPSQEFEFRIDLIPEAMLIVKSLYPLEPSEIEELLSQLRELQDKGYIRTSSSP